MRAETAVWIHFSAQVIAVQVDHHTQQKGCSGRLEFSAVRLFRQLQVGWEAEVYFQLENLSISDPPYKSVAALNCIILGCAYIWDLDRAFQTFEAIEKKFDLSADVHSYNALMSAFGKMKQTFEATNVFAHMTSLGVKPNEKSYSLLVDAHIFNRDTKSALAAVNDMMTAGYSPSKDTLWKIKRRCVREFDVEGDKQVQSLCQRLNYQMTGERRREMLFGLDYSTELI